MVLYILPRQLEILAMSVADAFGRFASASLEELTGIVGPVAAESIVNYFKDKNNQQIIIKLKEAGVDLDGYLYELKRRRR